MINASQKGQRGKMSGAFGWDECALAAQHEDAPPSPDSPRWAPAPALSGFQVLRDFMSRSRILRQRKGLN